MITEVIPLTKRMDPPSTKASDWPEQFLSYLLTQLTKTGKPTGAAFAEFDSDPIAVKVSIERENFLTKSQQAKTVYTVNLNNFLRFVTYLGKVLLKLDIPTMGCGLLKVQFEDEDEIRYFTLYLRRSSTLTGFFQIDQFHRHL